MTKAQETTKALIERATGASVQSVSCPSSVALRRGGSFTCVATGADGTTASVLVTETDDRGDVALGPPGLLETGQAEMLMASGLTATLKTRTTVKCPDLVTAQKGTTLTCRATSGQVTRSVVVTVTDDKGSIDYRVG
jgi:hypothetical protein